MGKDLEGRDLGKGITQRKDGTYCARYTDRWGERRYIYSKNVRTLRKDLAIKIAENELFTSVRDDVIVDKWYNLWMTTYKVNSVRPSTINCYSNVYKVGIQPYIGNRKMNTLTRADIQQVIDIAYEKGYAYERQNKIKVILKDMFQRAIEDNLLVTNPAGGVKLRSRKITKAKALTLDEQKDFLKFAEGTFYEHMYNIALNTGMRPGEMFALQLSDIDFEENVIHVTKTLVYQKFPGETRKNFHVAEPKTRQSIRDIPMNKVCLKHMHEQFKLKEIVANKIPKEQNDYLFVTKFNTKLNAQIYTDAIHRVVDLVNSRRMPDKYMPYFSGHTLRHTFATRCFEANVQPKVIQQYLGHATLKMTMDLYVHVTDDTAKDSISMIEDIMGS